VHDWTRAHACSLIVVLVGWPVAENRITGVNCGSESTAALADDVASKNDGHTLTHMPSFNFSKLFNSITILFWIIVTGTPLVCFF